MKHIHREESKIPISISLQQTIRAENIARQTVVNKYRLITISLLSVIIAACTSFIAKFLVYLINLVTNLSFYANWSVTNTSPANNSLGLWVIFIPVIGGVIVGLMALYGSKAIRGHGIPEAMEQILTNQSKIKPTITYLKPISSAIAIGTGGPFGAEGPIIATGGALGSTLGQLLRISHNERKILLSAGSAAGMAAIFGSPVAAIFLGIELLLFEFSPRSIIPLALACMTGAAGHHLLFGSGPVFAINSLVEAPGNIPLAVYSAMGITIGLLSVGVTKLVYLIEDSFEKLPIHWMWWPAIGGLAVGIVGYFYPRTLGVGYNNITDILTGALSIHLLLSLCIFKFISWAIALASGTSGGTLAPLFIIGGAAGALMGSFIQHYFPSSGISLPLCALVGMAAMFAGASRAFLTSIIFALETTGQPNALLPLLGACGGSYIVSFFLMESTIMTEKISRRGIKAPDSYEPDALEKTKVEEVMEKSGLLINENNSVDEVIEWLNKNPAEKRDYFIVADEKGEYRGIVKSSVLFSKNQNGSTLTGSLIDGGNLFISVNDSLRIAVERMANENAEALPVLSPENNNVVGILSLKNIMTTYKENADIYVKNYPSISLKRRSLKVILKGQKMINNWKIKKN